MTRPLKIAHVCSPIRLELGGVVRAVLDLAAETAKHGHDVTIATWDSTDVPKNWNNGNAHVPRVITIQPPQRLGKPAPKALESLERLIRACDVVHLHTPWEPINVHVARLCRSLGKPYVISIHGMLDDWCMTQRTLKKRVYLTLAARTMLEKAAAVHCTAKAELDQSKRWYPRGHGAVVPLVFDIEPYRTLPGPKLARDTFSIDPERPVVLFLSRVHVKKGVHILVDAAKELADSGVDAQFLIAGTGDADYTDKIKAQIKSLGLSNTVRLLGMVRGVEKVSLYQAADVFALPTSQENFGFVLPESLVSQTPAITTKGVDTWPELEASGSTLIVDQTAHAFAEAIASLLADPDRREQMGIAGRKWVLESLEPAIVAQQYESLYRAAAGEPAS